MDKHAADASDARNEGFRRHPIRRLVFCLTLILLVVGGYRAIAQEAQDMSAEFSPTLVNGDSPLLTPGTIIGPNNVDEYKNLLDQVLVEGLNLISPSNPARPTIFFLFINVLPQLAGQVIWRLCHATRCESS
jgi:hypothetical protein